MPTASTATPATAARMGQSFPDRGAANFPSVAGRSFMAKGLPNSFCGTFFSASNFPFAKGHPPFCVYDFLSVYYTHFDRKMQ